MKKISLINTLKKTFKTKKKVSKKKIKSVSKPKKVKAGAKLKKVKPIKIKSQKNEGNQLR